MFVYRLNGLNLPLAYSDALLKGTVLRGLGVKEDMLLSYRLVKKSLDARKKPTLYWVIAVEVTLKEKLQRGNTKIEPVQSFSYSLPSKPPLAQRPIVVGFGPAGMFAALILAQAGQRPIVLERGSSVEQRQKKVAAFWETRQLDENCNVQFGEGGAGTFSDGKLNTGVKDPRITKVLTELVKAGAPEEILWEAKPHIGTDKLPATVRGIREKIKALGGEIHFDTTVTGLTIRDGAITGVQTAASCFDTRHVVLCIGHSARDTFRFLEAMGIPMEPKGFSIGARVEHPAALIDNAQYGANHKELRAKGLLAAADYKLATRLPNGRGVYTFCMCPGGTVVGAASQKGMVVTNGMSSFARDGANSNAGLLVGIAPQDFGAEGALAGVLLQEKLETQAFHMAGETYNAPAQRLEDFLLKRESKSFGDVTPSYAPGVSLCDLNQLLPEFVCEAMHAGIVDMSRRLRGFHLPDAVLTGPETRSSSPLRILRAEDCQSVGVKGLYPCGEGAGYAGGIMSAALDGIRCAEMVHLGA